MASHSVLGVRRRALELDHDVDAAWTRDWNYVRKWLVLGILIGVVAGLGAIVFIFALEGCSKLLLETIGGYKPPLPIGEATVLSLGDSPGRGRSRWWLASEA